MNKKIAVLALILSVVIPFNVHGEITVRALNNITHVERSEEAIIAQFVTDGISARSLLDAWQMFLEVSDGEANDLGAIRLVSDERGEEIARFDPMKQRLDPVFRIVILSPPNQVYMPEYISYHLKQGEVVNVVADTTSLPDGVEIYTTSESCVLVDTTQYTGYVDIGTDERPITASVVIGEANAEEATDVHSVPSEDTAIEDITTQTDQSDIVTVEDKVVQPATTVSAVVTELPPAIAPIEPVVPAALQIGGLWIQAVTDSSTLAPGEAGIIASLELLASRAEDLETRDSFLEFAVYCDAGIDLVGSMMGLQVGDDQLTGKVVPTSRTVATVRFRFVGVKIPAGGKIDAELLAWTLPETPSNTTIVVNRGLGSMFGSKSHTEVVPFGPELMGQVTIVAP